jgi:hypothetical protein
MVSADPLEESAALAWFRQLAKSPLEVDTGRSLILSFADFGSLQ